MSNYSEQQTDVYAAFVKLVRDNGYNDTAIDIMVKAVLELDKELVSEPDLLAAYDILIEWYSVGEGDD